MKQQKGAVWIAVTGVIAFLALIVGVVAVSYISAYNFGNQMEKQLVATRDNNKNILAQYGQKVQEAAQVPGMMRDDVTKVVTAAIEGRYGPDGSKAVFQWIQEQNPSLDSKVYVQLQQIIEAGRNEFQQGQTRMIDIRRSYETSLGYFWQGMWLRIAGYPKVNMADFQPVSTDRADEAFKAGKEAAPLQLR
jgi:uncharacterized protein YneF (UPF0154 family)